MASWIFFFFWLLIPMAIARVALALVAARLPFCGYLVRLVVFSVSFSCFLFQPFNLLFSLSHFFIWLGWLYFCLGGCVRFFGPFRFIILRIETHLQQLFSLGIPLIQMSNFLNLGLGLGLIGYTDQFIPRHALFYIGNS